MKAHKSNGIWQNILKYSASVIFWLIIWLFAAKKIDRELLLPSPVTVVRRLIELLCASDFYITALTSLGRILLGILAGISAGIIFAVLTSFIPPLETLFSPIFSVIKATPVASFIMLALLWISNSLLPSFITFLIVFPVAWANTSQGIKNASKELLEIAEVYKLNFWEKVLHIYLPTLIPFFVSTAKSALGLAWKAGIAAEVLAVPQIAIGSKIYSSKVFLETTDLFVWTLITIVLSMLMEAAAHLLLSKLTTSYSTSKTEGGNND